jgi:hypothetical protein
LADVLFLPLFQQKWLTSQITFDVRANALNEIDDFV